MLFTFSDCWRVYLFVCFSNPRVSAFFYHSWQTVWWVFVCFHTVLGAWTNDSCFHIVYVHCVRILVCSAAPLFVYREETILYYFANQLFLTWEYFVCSEILVTCLQWNSDIYFVFSEMIVVFFSKSAIHDFCLLWHYSSLRWNCGVIVCYEIVFVCTEIVKS